MHSVLLLALLLTGSICAAEERRRDVSAAAVLQEPQDWRLERMSMPPGFARDVKLTGAEEIRFAPGMFDNTKPDYFTCIIALTLDQSEPITPAELQDFLEKYYGGLSRAVGGRKGFKTDPEKMKAVVTPTNPEAKDRFLAEVGFFDPFTDGRHITLHIEASQQPLSAAKKTGLILLVSPSAKESDVWAKLRTIGQQAEAHLSTLK